MQNLPNKTGSSQLAIGAGNTNWIAGDSSFNVTIAGIATVTASTGVVEATKFCGDGSCLTGLGAAGFNPDAHQNLMLEQVLVHLLMLTLVLILVLGTVLDLH